MERFTNMQRNNEQINEKKGIGNGMNIRVWWDPWVSGNIGNKAIPKFSLSLLDVNMTVNNLITPYTKRWNMDLLNNLFDQHIVSSIMKIYILESDEEDELAWS